MVMLLDYLTMHLVLHQSCRPPFCRKKVIHLLHQHRIESIPVLHLLRRRNDQVSTCRPVLQLPFGNMLILETRQ
jgi:hypothetical protein